MVSDKTNLERVLETEQDIHSWYNKGWNKVNPGWGNRVSMSTDYSAPEDNYNSTPSAYE